MRDKSLLEYMPVYEIPVPEERGTWISGHAVDALVQAGRREAYADLWFAMAPKTIHQRESESAEAFRKRYFNFLSQLRQDADDAAKARYPIAFDVEDRDQRKADLARDEPR